MAIRGVYKREDLNIEGGVPSGQPPPFRATGRGLGVRNRSIVANASNANASLVLQNMGTDRDQPWLQKIYLFVDSIETSWQLAGETTQSVDSRGFYPRNLSQSPLIIQGSMSNQFEYDKLVEFVQHSQRFIIDKVDEIIGGEQADQFDPVQVNSVIFSLFKPQGNNTYNHISQISKYDDHGGTQLAVAILDIKAGHERFKFQPAFTLTCKVLNDYLQQNYEVETDIIDQIDYVDIYGPMKNANPSVGPINVSITGQVGYTNSPTTGNPGVRGTAGPGGGNSGTSGNGSGSPTAPVIPVGGGPTGGNYSLNPKWLSGFPSGYASKRPDVVKMIQSMVAANLAKGKPGIPPGYSFGDGTYDWRWNGSKWEGTKV